MMLYPHLAASKNTQSEQKIRGLGSRPSHLTALAQAMAAVGVGALLGSPAFAAQCAFADSYNVTANNIALGSIKPAMPEAELEAMMASERVKAQLSRYVIRRYGAPEDIAAMALFLCSREASWITGQTYPVNGGYSFNL